MFSSSLKIGMITETMCGSIAGLPAARALPCQRRAHAPAGELDEARSGRPHALHGPLAITRGHIHAADAPFDDVDREARLARLEDRVDHAVVGRQAADHHSL